MIHPWKINITIHSSPSVRPEIWSDKIQPSTSSWQFWWWIGESMWIQLLVGSWPTPLKNDGVKVSWDYDIPNMMGKIIQSCSSQHQADEFNRASTFPRVKPTTARHLRFLQSIVAFDTRLVGVGHRGGALAHALTRGKVVVVLPEIREIFAKMTMITYFYWLVVLTILKNMSQLGLLFPIYGKS